MAFHYAERHLAICDGVDHRLAHDLMTFNQTLARRFPKIHDDGKGSVNDLEGIRGLADWQALELVCADYLAGRRNG